MLNKTAAEEVTSAVVELMLTMVRAYELTTGRPKLAAYQAEKDALVVALTAKSEK